MGLKLQPKPGFDWNRVGWGKPDSPRSQFCSYCFTTIPDDEVPLIIWKGDGHAAQFCRGCQKRWWGFESFDDPSYTCPRCGATSYNANDIEHRYCGRCHRFEDDPPPAL